MAEVASISSIILFLAFGTMGVWKVALTDAAAHAADRFGYERATYRRVGVVEVAAAVAVLVGLTATGSSVLAILNEVAAGVLVLLGAWGVASHLRAHEGVKSSTPIFAWGLLALLELIVRLTL